MLQVDYTRHGQQVEDLYRLGLKSAHARTRERFLALARVAQGMSAARLAPQIGRCADTVRGWIRRYNAQGPQALLYTHTGGTPPWSPDLEEALAPLLETQRAHDSPPWTLRRLCEQLTPSQGHSPSRETVRRALKRMGYSWKKAKKLLTRADPAKRETFVECLAPLLEEATRGERVLVFLDPAHIHQDCDLGYGWAPRGERLWAPSSSPGLSQRVTFYGIYIFNDAQVRIWPYDRANAVNTCEVVRRLRQELDRATPVTLIWDGAPYHRARSVLEEVQAQGLDLLPLPGYSPDFMPVEELWRWFRSEVTNAQVHTTSKELIQHAQRFEHLINQQPYAIADRLVVKDSLDPEVEKLRVSA